MAEQDVVITIGCCLDKCHLRLDAAHDVTLKPVEHATRLLKQLHGFGRLVDFLGRNRRQPLCATMVAALYVHDRCQ